MARPPEPLSPIWRCVPNGTGVGAVALDPRDAEFVLERGFLVLDGERWNVTLSGWGGTEDLDGRVSMRLMRT